MYITLQFCGFYIVSHISQKRRSRLDTKDAGDNTLQNTLETLKGKYQGDVLRACIIIFIREVYNYKITHLLMDYRRGFRS